MAAADAFAQMGLARRLVLGEDELRAAFREAGKRLHPDAGGDEDSFARLAASHALLQDPGRRLRHWLECHGIEVADHGPLPGQVMDLFAAVGRAIQQADEALRQRDSARSALAKALLEPRTLAARDALAAARAKVEAAIQAELALFPSFEAAPGPAAADHARALAFLGKWQDQLRAKFAALA